MIKGVTQPVKLSVTTPNDAHVVSLGFGGGSGFGGGGGSGCVVVVGAAVCVVCIPSSFSDVKLTLGRSPDEAEAGVRQGDQRHQLLDVADERPHLRLEGGGGGIDDWLEVGQGYETKNLDLLAEGEGKETNIPFVGREGW